MSLNYKELNEYIHFYTVIESETTEYDANYVINIALEQHAPIRQFNYRYCLAIRANEVNEGGFPSGTDSDLMHEIEDELISILETMEIIKVGMVTYNGLRLIYFYGTENIEFTETVNSIMEKHPDLIFRASKYIDNNWDLYLNELLPTEIERHSFYNGMIMHNLLENGDNLTSERTINFYLYFPNNHNATNALEQIQNLKFSGEITKINEEKFQIHATKFNNIIPDIHKLVISLIEIANTNSGYFDKWECPIAE